MALLAFNTTLVPAHILPEETVMIGLAMALTVNVDVLVQVPLDPMMVPVATGAPLEVPMMVAPFSVFVVRPTIGPQV